MLPCLQPRRSHRPVGKSFPAQAHNRSQFRRSVAQRPLQFPAGHAINGDGGCGRDCSVITVAAIVAIDACQYAQATTSVRYVTAPVTRGAVMRTVTASGSVNPLTTIQVGTYVSGVIHELYCDYNTLVRKGQRCAKIDPRPYQVIVDQGRANLSAARAQLTKDRTSLALAKLT